MALWGLGYKNGDWIWELAFGGGIFRVIFGLGGLCLLLFVPIDEEGFVIMEVGDVGVVIFLFLIVFPVLNRLALHFWDSLSNSKSSFSDSVNSQFNRHVVVASPLEPRSHSLGIRNYINQLMGSLLNPLAISIFFRSIYLSVWTLPFLFSCDEMIHPREGAATDRDVDLLPHEEQLTQSWANQPPSRNDILRSLGVVAS